MASVAARAYVPGPLRRARTPGVCAVSVALPAAANGSGVGWQPTHRPMRGCPPRRFSGATAPSRRGWHLLGESLRIGHCAKMVPRAARIVWLSCPLVAMGRLRPHHRASAPSGRAAKTEPRWPRGWLAFRLPAAAHRPLPRGAPVRPKVARRVSWFLLAERRSGRAIGPWRRAGAEK